MLKQVVASRDHREGGREVSPSCCPKATLTEALEPSRVGEVIAARAEGRAGHRQDRSDHRCRCRATKRAAEDVSWQAAGRRPLIGQVMSQLREALTQRYPPDDHRPAVAVETAACISNAGLCFDLLLPVLPPRRLDRFSWHITRCEPAASWIRPTTVLASTCRGMYPRTQRRYRIADETDSSDVIRLQDLCRTSHCVAFVLVHSQDEDQTVGVL